MMAPPNGYLSSGKLKKVPEKGDENCADLRPPVFFTTKLKKVPEKGDENLVN